MPLLSAPPLNPWFSRASLYTRLFVSLGIPAVTLMLTYLLWLFHGCQPNLPFISDTGMYGAQRVVFTVGALATAFPFTATMIDAAIIRLHLMKMTKKSTPFIVFDYLISIWGMITIWSFVGVGFFPWDEYLLPHVVFAVICLVGGMFWTAGNTLISLIGRYRLKDKNPSRDWRLTLAISFLVVEVICVVVLVPTIQQHRRTLLSELEVARTNFDGYCMRNTPRMSDTVMNGCALLEWILVVAIFTSGGATISADYDLYHTLHMHEFDDTIDDSKTP